MLPAPFEVIVVVDPCNRAVWPLTPTVKAALGVILFVFTPAKVGVAPLLMFWIVFTAPPATLKLVPLKLAIPLLVVLASSIVIVEPDPLALAMFNPPVRPFSELTPPLDGQAAQVGAPAVESKHSPAPAEVTDVTAAVPWPTSTPLEAREVAPVPPFGTDKALLSVRPPVTTLRSPVIVTVKPLWVITEFSIFCEAVNSGI